MTAESSGRTFVGISPAAHEIRTAIDSAARSNGTVLIRGETGSGKGLVARAIHAGGARSARPMVHVDCAAFAPSLLESELFGSEHGAFTGAVARGGLLEASAGGTIFLDEVGELPATSQAKLWRAEFLEAEAVVRCRCTFFFALGFAAIGAGCSNIGTDSALPSETELPKAGYRIVLVDDGPGGSDGCHSPTHTATMGDVTDTTAPHLVSEAEGATVECRVARVGLEAGGEGFAVSVNLRNARNRLVVSIPSLAAWSTPSDPALGHVVIASPETGGDYSSPAESPCPFFYWHS